jgi:hypothetical protein
VLIKRGQRAAQIITLCHGELHQFHPATMAPNPPFPHSFFRPYKLANDGQDTRASSITWGGRRKRAKTHGSVLYAMLLPEQTSDGARRP